MQFKQKDLEIITVLRKDGRAQLTEISRKTSIPVSTIYDKLKNKSQGLIQKHVCLINFDKLGFNTRASICLKCGKSCKTELAEFAQKHQNVNSFYKINNGYDFMLEVVFKNVKELEEFVELLEEKYSIRSKQVYYIIEDLMREGFFSDKIHVGSLIET